MTITQLNLYGVQQDLSNMGNNVDYNRVGVDKTDITVNHTTSPWTFTIKKGSMIEKDGNLYIVDTSDYTLQATNNTHNYIVFTGTAFASAATSGTYDPDKGGHYLSGSRVLKFYIDPTADLEYTMNEFNNRKQDQYVENDLIIANDINVRNDINVSNDVNVTEDVNVTGKINCYITSTASDNVFTKVAHATNTETQKLIVYKPCSMLFQAIASGTTTGTSQITTYYSIDGSSTLQESGAYAGIEDAAFYSVFPVYTGIDYDSKVIRMLNPGKYMFEIDNSALSAGTVTLTVLLLGAYGTGDVIFTAGSVFGTVW